MVLAFVQLTAPRGVKGASSTGYALGRLSHMPPPRLLAHYAIAVPVIHKGIRGVIEGDRRNAVPSRLGAGDAAVPVVVVQMEHVTAPDVQREGRDRRGKGDSLRGQDDHRRRRASLQDGVKHVPLAGVDGEAVHLAHLHNAVREPAPVQGGEPFRRVVATLLGAVGRRAGEGQVQHVRGEPALCGGVRCAVPAVVGLGAGDDVLDVGFAGAGEPRPCVGAVNDAPMLATTRCSTDWR